MIEKDYTAEKRALLKKVQEADFFALDLQLYLNTHPYCKKTLEMYKTATDEAKTLRKNYENMYGPLTASSSGPETPWQWIENPWTWEKERS